jgi:CheY-like chemotaxis protein
MVEKVLLVDDEKDFLEVMAERMAARGIEVSTASSATEAIRLAEKESFDAIIVDLMMPEMDGIEALKLLKKKKPETQVILLTGHATLDRGHETRRGRLSGKASRHEPADKENQESPCPQNDGRRETDRRKNEENNGPKRLVDEGREVLR